MPIRSPSCCRSGDRRSSPFASHDQCHWQANVCPYCVSILIAELWSSKVTNLYILLQGLGCQQQNFVISFTWMMYYVIFMRLFNIWEFPVVAHGIGVLLVMPGWCLLCFVGTSHTSTALNRFLKTTLVGGTIIIITLINIVLGLTSLLKTKSSTSNTGQGLWSHAPNQAGQGCEGRLWSVGPSQTTTSSTRITLSHARPHIGPPAPHAAVSVGWLWAWLVIDL